VYISVQEE